MREVGQIRNVRWCCKVFLQAEHKKAYSSLSLEDAADHETVKTAVLKVYDLVPEAYRQKFRSWNKTEKHVEFVRDISIYFNRLCMASNVNTLDDLKYLLVLKQFKNSISDRIATFISERKPATEYEAAF